MSYEGEGYCFHFSVWEIEAVLGVMLLELTNSCHRLVYFGDCPKP